MWYPPDPDEPTSELYRLMPRRPRSELREALDAATGRDHAEPGHYGEATPAAALEPDGPSAKRTGTWLGPFLGNTLANAAGAILAALVIAFVSYLLVHHASHTPARLPTARPSSIAHR
jgi:hypothetical protein